VLNRTEQNDKNIINYKLGIEDEVQNVFICVLFFSFFGRNSLMPVPNVFKLDSVWSIYILRSSVKRSSIPWP